MAGGAVYVYSATPPALGPAGAGTVRVGGTVRDVLLVNGSSGGGIRQVGINCAPAGGTPFTIEMTGDVVGAPYVIFGYLAIPTDSDVFSVDGLGDLCFVPDYPGLSGPASFTLATTGQGLRSRRSWAGTRRRTSSRSRGDPSRSVADEDVGDVPRRALRRERRGAGLSHHQRHRDDAGALMRFAWYF